MGPAWHRQNQYPGSCGGGPLPRWPLSADRLEHQYRCGYGPRICGTTLWHGTLQLLGERRSDDYLIRLPAPHTCAQLARFLATPGAHIDMPDLSAPENPDCPLCRIHDPKRP